jgi:hypothetical protein
MQRRRESVGKMAMMVCEVSVMSLVGCVQSCERRATGLAFCWLAGWLLAWRWKRARLETRPGEV